MTRNRHTSNKYTPLGNKQSGHEPVGMSYVIKRVHTRSGSFDFVAGTVEFLRFRYTWYTLWMKRGLVVDAETAASLIEDLNKTHDQSPYYFVPVALR
jgi:hypothetical protein